MPRAKEKSSAGLSIELSENRPFYTPGSSISGNVTLNTAEDFAIGSVTVEFYGRVKVYFVYSHGQGESQWRGRAPLFSQSQLLYQGYHTHKPGSFSWPFVVELPKNPDIATVRQSKHQWDNREHFLSTNDYIPGHQMPPTFRFRKWGFGYRYHAFVEYVIKVDVKEAPGASMVLPPTSRKATRPIMVKHIASSEPETMTLPCAAQFTLPQQLTEKLKLDDPTVHKPGFHVQSSRETVRSSRLLENHNLDRPSTSFSISTAIRDKAKLVVNPDSLPRFTFDISVSTPESIKLLDPLGIPVIVNATPVRDDGLTTISCDSYPRVHVENISLCVESSTYVRFKSILPSSRKNSYNIKLLDRSPVKHTIDLSPNDHHAPFHEHNDSDLTETPRGVDLSKLSGVSTALMSAKLGWHTEKPLSTTFNTYIIAREYYLSYRIELDIAGERVRLSNTDKLPLKVLPPEASDLERILRDSDANTAEVGDEGDQDDSDGESTEVKDADKKLLGRLGKRKTKAEEAAEDAASSQAEASNHAQASSANPLQYEPEERLPSYEPNPTEFGYRHEIDERPPRYEAE